jgi:hypothetical protein
MGPTKKSQKEATARACAVKFQKNTVNVHDASSDSAIEQSKSDDDYNSDIECTGWMGGVNHILSNIETDLISISSNSFGA